MYESILQKRKFMRKFIVIASLLFAHSLSAIAAQKVPLWVTNRTAQFPDNQYVSALGSGSTMQEAKDDALSQLALYFNAQVAVEQNAHLSMTEGGEKHRSIENGVSVKSDAEVPQCSFTTPFRNEKPVEWFVCAYIERSVAADFCTAQLERCVSSVQIALNSFSKKSPSFADMQILSEEKHNLARAEKLLENLILLSRSAQDTHSAKIRRLRADMEASLAKARSVATFRVAIQGDNGGEISTAIKKILVSQGMSLSPRGRYCVSGKLSMTFSENDVGVFARPNISLNVIDEASGKSVYSFIKQYKKRGHKNADGARTKALVEVEKDIRENFRPAGEI